MVAREWLPRIPQSASYLGTRRSCGSVGLAYACFPLWIRNSAIHLRLGHESVRDEPSDRGGVELMSMLWHLRNRNRDFKRPFSPIEIAKDRRRENNLDKGVVFQDHLYPRPIDSIAFNMPFSKRRYLINRLDPKLYLHSWIMMGIVSCTILGYGAGDVY